MEEYGVDAVPFQHEKMDEWRDSLRAGVQYLHAQTNLLLTGGVDDIWVNPQDELLVVDYKATAKESEVTLDAEWQRGYKRQMEFYQWLLRRNGFKVSSTAYFVYCNGSTDRAAFDKKIEFRVKLIPYTGDDGWIEPTILEAHVCLNADELPSSSADCDYCRYRTAAKQAEAR